jgi:hypothetical protein
VFGHTIDCDKLRFKIYCFFFKKQNHSLFFYLFVKEKTVSNNIDKRDECFIHKHAHTHGKPNYFEERQITQEKEKEKKKIH